MLSVDVDSLHLLSLFDEQFAQWSVAYISEVDKTFDNTFVRRVLGGLKLYRRWFSLFSNLLSRFTGSEQGNGANVEH